MFTPRYSTEPEFIDLVDVNGIGTNVTMANNIIKVNTRRCVFTHPVDSGAAVTCNDGDGATPREGR